MSINVTVGTGQGITQAIKSHLQQQGVKLTNVKLSDWQQVMSLVNQNQQMNVNAGKDSIFRGGNDSSKIGQGANNNWQTDFQVTAGQVMQFDAGIFNKIVAILTGKAQETPAAADPPVTQTVPQNAPKPPELDATPAGLGQLNTEISDSKIELPDGTPKQSAEEVTDRLGGKIIEREVDGKKQNISVVDINGEKVRRAVNEDGTLGDTLVPISTMGKNKYITQTKMDNMMRQALGLPEDAELPQDIQGSFVSIGGNPTLIFKKDGKTLDQAGLREYVQNLKQGQASQQMQEQGAIDVSDSQKLAQETFDTINNNFGDKQGNITAEEYINYELQTASADIKAQFTEEQIRTAAQMSFNAMDASQDGEITVDELKSFIEASNGNNDDTVTDTEMATYVSDENAAEQDAIMQQNITNVVQDGYQISQLDNGSFVYTKDGKNYTVNNDGSLGAELLQPQLETQVYDQPPVYANPEDVPTLEDFGIESNDEWMQAQMQEQIYNQTPVYKGFESQEQQANINQAISDGYQVTTLNDGNIAFTKDGKNYSVNQDGTLGKEIISDAPQVNEAPTTDDAPPANEVPPTNDAKSLTKQDIDNAINNLKPGEEYSYQSNIDLGYYQSSTPVTWARNEDGTLTQTKVSPNFSNKTFDSLETVYSEDRSRIIKADSQKYIFGAMTIVTENYDDKGNVTSQTSNMKDILSSARGNLLNTTFNLINTTEKNASKYAEQTFKDVNGEVLLTFKDGQWFNEDGKEISQNKAHKIMDKAKENENLGEFVQIPIQE